MTDEKKAVSTSGSPEPQKCIYCGKERPNPMPPDYVAVCFSGDNDTEPNPISGRKFHRYESDEDAALVDLVQRFSAALLDKLRASEAKYGWRGGWRTTDWHNDLLRDIRKHVDKGDPRDVAAYCAFAWHHGWTLKTEIAPETEEWVLREIWANADGIQKHYDSYEQFLKHMRNYV